MAKNIFERNKCVSARDQVQFDSLKQIDLVVKTKEREGGGECREKIVAE